MTGLTPDEIEQINNSVSETFPSDVLTQTTEQFTDEPNFQCLDGIPRFAHKTTECVHRAEEADNEHNIVIAQNHTLAQENVTDKIIGEQFGIGENTAVHIKGKEKSCGGCDMCADGLQSDDYPIIQDAIQDAITRYDYIRPEVFTEICPYYGCLFAIDHVSWISTVPEMWPRIRERVSNDRSVIIDEESTMSYWMPDSGPILKCHIFEEARQTFSIKDHTLSESGIDYVRTRVQNKLNELERPPGRYRNVRNAVRELQNIYDQLEEFKLKVLPYCDSVEEVQEAVSSYIDINTVDFQGTEREKRATFKYLRLEFSRSATATLLESLFFDPRIKVMPSQGQVTFNLVPDPLAGFMIDRDLFAEANDVWFVGRHYATYIASHFHNNPQDQIENLSAGDVPSSNELEIITIAADPDEELQRRGEMTRIAKELTIEHEHHNLLIAGSGTRASNAVDSIGRRAHFFNGQDDLPEYKDIASIDWNVTSYLGSRLTRGVDVDTNVTIVRSTKFATPNWDYYNDGENIDEIDLSACMERIRKYENYIETHNAMLRGAGQREKHIAIIPGDIDLLWDLDEVAVEYDYLEHEEIIDHILDSLGLIDCLAPGEYGCPVCGTIYVVQQQALNCCSDSPR